MRRSRLYEEVVERLRELIDVQELRPGDRLMSERELAERLGVSRTSVRQALTALEVMGLVDVRHGGGVFLARALDDVLPSLATQLVHSHEQLPAVVEVREAIETQTARLAARRRSDEDLREMHEALARMEAAIDSNGDPASADAEFHTAIVNAAGNPLLVQLWAELSDSIDQTRRASLARPGVHPRASPPTARSSPPSRQPTRTRAAAAMREHLSVVADLGFLT